MKGHLHLVCSRGDTGTIFLRKQSFRAPLHLSKPHDDDGVLVVNMVSPTAGIFDDDTVDVDITVEAGASLLLTTPTATRVYKSRDGSAAKWRQSFLVHENAFLEYFPEPFIPHSGARMNQQTTLRIASGAGLMFFEWLSPGRSASGESFEFSELNWDLDLWCGGKLAARERYTLRPDDDSLTALRFFSPEAHYLGCIMHGISPDVAAIHALATKDVYIGCGSLAHGSIVIKAICKDALSARRAIQALRHLLYASQDRRPPWTGRF